MKIQRPLLFLFSLGILTVFSQDHETYQVSLLANVGIPSAELKEAVDNPVGGIAVGFGFNALFNPKGKKGYSPVFVGADFSYITFGRDKQPSTPTAPPYKTSFNYYGISGLSRFFLSNKEVGFVPFVDGQLGVKIFNTRTKIDKNVVNIILNDDEPEVINTTNDAGLGYALGGGFYARKTLNENGNRDVSFTLRAMYHFGDQTSYVKRGSIQVDNGTVSYQTGYTRTNMIMIQLGIIIN
ncbi:MAG: hypothetical protein KF725_05055 [Cyclobacteriaceae bacterium]|nr:hypothetical protein [Cyclobacteriaceae bacterium]UYN85845.1 MAG: hypothetical protein KIT51_13335 [Cyclobacteriaceae bacterium]